MEAAHGWQHERRWRAQLLMAKDDDATLLSEARERFAAGVEYDRENRDEDLDDRRFLAGEQYPAEVLAERAGRPCEVYNRLPQFVKQVTGEMRQNKPEIRVLPTDEGSDKELAKVYSAIIRHIENLSDAHRAYVKAGEHAVQGGIGYFRVLTDFVDENSFDQDIVIKAIRNPLSVVFDPDAQEATKRDATWCFVTEMVSAKKFKAKHPKVAVDGFEQIGMGEWAKGDFIRVAEYWVRKRDGDKTLAYCSDGATREVDPAAEEGGVLNINEQPVQIVRLRKVPRYKVCWHRMTGTAIIDRGDWQGSTIPIFPVIGEEIEIGERTIRHGLIRHAKGSQRTYNYFRNAAVEHVALQPKAPFLVTAKQIQAYKGLWDTANQGNKPYLPYDVDPQAPPPQRMAPPTTPTAMYQEAQIADADMKATTGIYDASLGQRSNETSGRAILARQQEGDTGTFVYVDNLTAAIQAAGKVLVELIPLIYTSERIIRMVGEDGKVEGFARINGSDEMGRPINDLSTGKYDVVVTTGPAYASRRQMAAESMMQFAQAVPQAMPLMADLIPDSMDWPNADKIAERLRKALPQGIDKDIDAERAKEAQADPAAGEAQQKQAQMQEEAAMIALRTQDFAAQLAEAKANLAELDVEMRRIELERLTMGPKEAPEAEEAPERGERVSPDMDGAAQTIARMAATVMNPVDQQMNAIMGVLAQMNAPRIKVPVRDENGLIIAVREVIEDQGVPEEMTADG
jgi:hypothetical protein